MPYIMIDQRNNRWSVTELKQLIAEIRAEIRVIEAGYGLSQAQQRTLNPLFDHVFRRVRSRWLSPVKTKSKP
jgi:uncharacterized small protein (DUF1192 family)